MSEDIITESLMAGAPEGPDMGESKAAAEDPEAKKKQAVKVQAVEFALADFFPKFNVRPEILTQKEILKGMFAEFVATALFVWIGCGTAISMQAEQTAFDGPTSNDFISTVAMAFGFGITVLVYAIAPISGGHINPAVTFALWLVRDIDANRLILFTIAQFAGAFLGALVIWGCTTSNALTNDGKNPPFLLAANFLTDSVSIGNAFLLESVGTFLLVFTVLFTAVYKKNIAANMAPAAIGWSVMLAHFVLIPFTGCGINPARSFGPHLVDIIDGVKVGKRGWWVYYTAPYVGALFAAMMFKTLYQLAPEKPTTTPALAPKIAEKVGKLAGSVVKSKKKEELPILVKEDVKEDVEAEVGKE